ncbi:MAG: hypothetical protein JNL57_13950 [Bacteroidetes bacterium]|nr:hypothetical protein [Bacteroidota bacterium]
MPIRRIYILSLFLYLLYSLWCFIHFGLEITDSDQSLMWQAALDISQGKVYVPLFYGQAYNSMAEAWLAAPLVWAGVPACRAVPLITWLMGITPVLIAQWMAVRRSKYGAAVFILLFAALLPDSFVQTCQMSRGFVQGVFFTSIGAGILLAGRKSHWIAGTGVFFILFGLGQNPNAIFLLAPVVFSTNLRRISWKQGVAGICGLLLAVSFFVFAQYWYRLHPQNLIHVKSGLFDWSGQILISQLPKSNAILRTVFPGGVFGLVILLALSLWWFAGQRRTQLAFIFLIIAVFFSMGSTKTTEASDNVFFGYSRFYLALPLALLFLVSGSNRSIKIPNIPFYLLALPVFLFFAFRSFQFRTHSNLQEINKAYIPLMVEKISTVKSDCEKAKDSAQKYGAKGIVVGGHYLLELFSCGCNALVPDYPAVMRPSYERRPWLYKDYENLIPGKVIFLELWQKDSAVFKKFTGIKRDIRGAAFILETGTLNFPKVADSLVGKKAH